VCAAAAKGGRFNSSSIFLVKADSHHLDIAATAGPTADNARRLKISIDETRPEGQGLCGVSFRTRQASAINDFDVDPRMRAFRDAIQRDNAASGAALPLFVNARTVGAMLFISSERNAFSPELVELLQRLADNVSFAMENFDCRRKGESRRAEGAALAHAGGAERDQ